MEETIAMIITMFFVFSPYFILYGFQIFLFIKRLMKKGSKKGTLITILILNIAMGLPVLAISLGFGAFALDAPSSTTWDYFGAVLIMNIPNIIFGTSAIIDFCIRKRFTV